jgi:hypothetical protein
VFGSTVYANVRCELASQACLNLVYSLSSWNSISFQNVSVVVFVLCACPLPFIVTKQVLVAIQYNTGM